MAEGHPHGMESEQGLEGGEEYWVGQCGAVWGET